jgi:hypothetical protein
MEIHRTMEGFLNDPNGYPSYPSIGGMFLLRSDIRAG